MDGLTAGAAYQAGSDTLATLLRSPWKRKQGTTAPSCRPEVPKTLSMNVEGMPCTASPTAEGALA